MLTARAFDRRRPADDLVLLAVGKTAGVMARVAIERLGSSIQRGLVIGRAGDRRTVPVQGIDWLAGGHPLPTPDSEHAGRLALALAESVGRDQTLLVLLSGGASSLMAVPAEGVTLADKRRTTERLLASGADIHALNAVRKHVSAIKGGRLAARVAGRCHTMVISDVVGDDLSEIGSGPTARDRTTADDALTVLDTHGGRAVFPSGVVKFLEDQARVARPGPARADDVSRATSELIGTRHDAVRGAATEARRLGYTVVTIEAPVVGEARIAARQHLLTVAKCAKTLQRPACVISSGETTVRVAGTGKGGRNQEFALAALASLGSAGESVALASVGTDGVDGPTEAAGAVVDSTTSRRAELRGLASDECLRDNNAFAFFDALGDLIHTGPTDTNVGDIQIVLIGP